MDQINILGVGVNSTSIDTAANQIEQWIKTNSRKYITVANVHTIVESLDNADLKAAHHAAAMVTPDGVPLVWFGKISGFKEISRVYGPDLMIEICRRSVDGEYKHFFLGSTDKVLENLQLNLEKLFPGIQIAGAFSPPFGPLSSVDSEKMIAEINQSGADVLWVGLGAPKQEIWMAENIERLDTSIAIGVGAAFDFIAGNKPKAPTWMQRFGLEWLFRLITEPRRLWRRYLSTNPRYIYNATLQLCGLKKFPISPK